MFTIIYEPLDTRKKVPEGWPPQEPSRAVQALSFWLGAQADDGQRGPFSIRTGKPKEPKTLDPTAAPFKIVVGGVYRCRDGWLVYISRRKFGAATGNILFAGRRINPITSETSKEELWDQDGTFHRAFYGDFHDYTIVAPYTQPQES